MTELLKYTTFAITIFFTKNLLAGEVIELKPTGPQPMVIDHRGAERHLYKESHALLISSSRYLGAHNGGWDALDGTHEEMDAVAKELQRHGFHVIHMKDPKSDEIHSALRSFGTRYGSKPDNRIVVFFSGHGHTNTTNQFGYIVPVDAKNPTTFPVEFGEKAIPITTFDIMAQEITARHAIFIFDSCFSGSIFKTRAENPPSIMGLDFVSRTRFFTGAAYEPVRQFITAGSADQKLPNKSVFIPLFIHALKFGTSPKNDGYITGQELGQWIKQTLPGSVRGNYPQSPQSNVIQDPRYQFGDMVFAIGGANPKSDKNIDLANDRNQGINKNAVVPPSTNQVAKKIEHPSSNGSNTDISLANGIQESSNLDNTDPNETSDSLRWSAIDKLSFSTVQARKTPTVNFFEAIKHPECYKETLSPNGKIMVAKIKGGLGFFETENGRLVKKFIDPDYIETTIDKAAQPCEIYNSSKFFANGTKFLIVTKPYTTSRNIYKPRSYWTVDLTSLEMVELKFQQNERLEMVFGNDNKDELVAFSWLPEKYSLNPRKNKNVTEYSVGDVLIRTIQSNGRVAKEKRFPRSMHSRIGLEGEFLHSLEGLVGYDYSKLFFTGSYIVGREDFFSIDEVMDVGVVKKISYSNIGCKSFPRFVILRSSDKFSTFKYTSSLAMKSDSICIVETQGKPSGKSYPVPEFGTKGKGSVDIVSTEDGNILTMSKNYYSNNNRDIIKYDLRTGLAASPVEVAINGDIDKSGINAVSWYRPSVDAKEALLYMVNLNKSVY